MNRSFWRRIGAGILLAVICFGATVAPVVAAGQVLGAHVLAPSDLDQASRLFDQNQNSGWRYLTIPLSLADLNKLEQWQGFFRQLSDRKFVPIVRLVTKFENGNWQRPNRKQIIDYFNFLNQLPWPVKERYVIVFNEVNHAQEWGGQVDPSSYLKVLKFASAWAHTEDHSYLILPAALDLDAPNGSQTKEAFAYLEELFKLEANYGQLFDIWNSHSYPNPGFSASPQKVAKNSLRGFEYELSFLKKKTGRDYLVMITETGWQANRQTQQWLESYYLYALQHVWTNPQVLAVTPFVVKGSPGPFASFSFFDASDQPTVQYQALRAALSKLDS